MYLTLNDKKTDLERFYRIEILRGLFDEWALVREWGCIGSKAQCRTDWFTTEAEAKEARFDVHMKKAKLGYE
ncbi:WGR domain-containing protein [Sulfitobacter sp. F26204]|uniref:WGR domain-containing protein n=1 Tax=Sulfitobacter sp. F26204 TaxID=2996014 RepID=UPI00225E1A28|nr:WGR domain-containing protein [Sulfitobacter sp. F26204]MCX7560251.1 WGR domain-containing protein [Sulfitobacter sp. F26204]